MNRKNLKIALLGVLGACFADSNLFADCACIYADPAIEGSKYWCCTSPYQLQPGNGAYICETPQGQTTGPSTTKDTSCSCTTPSGGQCPDWTT